MSFVTLLLVVYGLIGAAGWSDLPRLHLAFIIATLTLGLTVFVASYDRGRVSIDVLPDGFPIVWGLAMLVGVAVVMITRAFRTKIAK